MIDWNDTLRTFTALFVIVDPIGSVPLYLAFTENLKSRRKHIARITALAVGIILCVTVIGGETILSFFHISIDAFRVAGGVLLLMIALNMLQASRGRTKHTPEEDKEAMGSNEVAVVPLAMPLLAGPGAISTVILLSHQTPTLTGKITLTSICVLIALVTWITLRLAPQIDARLSTTSINVAMRIMGLILAAIAVEFIVGGLRNLLPGLAAIS